MAPSASSATNSSATPTGEFARRPLACGSWRAAAITGGATEAGRWQAYVSIRQYTSAFVSFRQHAALAVRSLRNSLSLSLSRSLSLSLSLSAVTQRQTLLKASYTSNLRLLRLLWRRPGAGRRELDFEPLIHATLCGLKKPLTGP